MEGQFLVTTAALSQISECINMICVYYSDSTITTGRRSSSSQTDIWVAECHYELPKHFKKKARIMSMCLKALNPQPPLPPKYLQVGII